MKQINCFHELLLPRERVTFKYPHERRVLKYRKYIQGHNKTNKLLFMKKLLFFGSLHFLYQSALSSFLVLAVLENTILTSLSYIKPLLSKWLLLTGNKHSLCTSATYLFDIKVSNIFLGGDSNWHTFRLHSFISSVWTLTHWGRGHLNCLNARSRCLNNLNQLLYCVSLKIYNKFVNYFCELKFSGNTHQRP